MKLLWLNQDVLEDRSPERRGLSLPGSHPFNEFAFPFLSLHAMLLPEQPHLLPLPLFSISGVREPLGRGHSNLQAPPAQRVSRNALHFHGPQVHLSLCPGVLTQPLCS